MRRSIVWFRQDLRIQDNTALVHAVESGFEVIPLYIWDPASEGSWSPGGASRWWLHHALKSLDASFAAIGGKLWIGSGDCQKVIRETAKRLDVDAVFWNRRYEPEIIRRDTIIKSDLVDAGLQVESFNASLIWEPHTVSTGQGKAYQVFTPFWKQVSRRSIPSPQTLDVDRLKCVEPDRSDSLTVEALDLLPSIPWDSGMEASWEVSELAATRLLEKFAQEALDVYHDDRDIPSVIGTSRLSPYLHFGQIGPRQIWASIAKQMSQRGLKNDTYLKEIAWREFAHHVMYHFPHTPQNPLREKFAMFPWSDDAHHLRAWQQGKTGYPIVDAGMRELWHTGWMHNRVRMIVASFLVKHLLISWYEGARWFWDTLVDADLASNTLGWQWAGGCGADAAPYFRIFNPMTQGKKFDATGEYVRKWCPELNRVPNLFIHEPWMAPANVLEYAGVDLGVNYPMPIVDHQEARAAALNALETTK
ncbi:MAG: deoxyribodipyrimidine photo-lyase [Cyanobacteria bacterium P01_A01_bin.68]